MKTTSSDTCDEAIIDSEQKNAKYTNLLVNYLLPSVLILLFIVFAFINPRFASFQNFGNILKQAAPALIL
jgi:ribose/xylose/arabinose/galactoside ABC-type transport system permease subunit